MLTLKLFRQAPDCTILLNDLEEGGVQLLLHLRQLRGHPDAVHTHPAMMTSESERDKK
jgi:hypothetical protein